MKTIREIAEELNVSKTTIRNHINKLPENLSVTKKGNVTYLDTDVEAFLKDKVQTVSDNFSQRGLQEVESLKERVTMLQERNEELKQDSDYLREQIKDKNKQIENLSSLLGREQELQMKSYQELESYKQERQQLLEYKQEQEDKQKQGFWSKLFGGQN